VCVELKWQNVEDKKYFKKWLSREQYQTKDK
jgi:hypothetical protein